MKTSTLLFLPAFMITLSACASKTPPAHPTPLTTALEGPFQIRISTSIEGLNASEQTPSGKQSGSFQLPNVLAKPGKQATIRIAQSQMIPDGIQVPAAFQPLKTPLNGYQSVSEGMILDVQVDQDDQDLNLNGKLSLSDIDRSGNFFASELLLQSQMKTSETKTFRGLSPSGSPMTVSIRLDLIDATGRTVSP